MEGINERVKVSVHSLLTAHLGTALISGIRLADMQQREPTCRIGCPRSKKTSGRVRPIGENCGSTFRFRDPRCKNLCLKPNGNEIVKNKVVNGLADW